MKSTKFIEYSKMIETEFANACIKHPKFCDAVTNKSENAVKKALTDLRIDNSGTPYYADQILHEEICEALEAYQQGEKAHCLQELAQCAAVILRMMEFVDAEQ